MSARDAEWAGAARSIEEGQVPWDRVGVLDMLSDATLTLLGENVELRAALEAARNTALDEAARALDEVASTPRKWMQYPEAARIVRALLSPTERPET